MRLEASRPGVRHLGRRFRKGGADAAGSKTEERAVRSRLTNLVHMRAGEHPEWFDSEPFELRDRVRRCRTTYWRISGSLSAGERYIMVLTAPAGMGKTSFLAGLHSMLIKSPDDLLVLSPNHSADNGKPFSALRDILGQRCYLPADESGEGVRPFVEGAVRATVPVAEAEGVTRGLMCLWRKGGVGRREYGTVADAAVTFFRHDVSHNSIVVIIDDADRHDVASLDVLVRAYAGGNGTRPYRFALILTAGNRDALQAHIREEDADFVDLPPLGDVDLLSFTHHVLDGMSATACGVPASVPEDVCVQIARRAYGIPKRAVELAARYFNPVGGNSWREVMEGLKQEESPAGLGESLTRRFSKCGERERLVLRMLSLLAAPFTRSTLESLMAAWEDGEAVDNCGAVLKELVRSGFLEKAGKPYGFNTASYVFRHEYERCMIAEGVPDPVKMHVYGTAAQWYALNNTDRSYDEVVGDLWCRHGSNLEGCHYFVRAGYGAYRRAEFLNAYRLFSKIIRYIPKNSKARAIQYSLDGAEVCFRLGRTDEAFMLCRRSERYASELSSYAQEARACIQMADMMIEMGRLRHTRRYHSRAARLLNLEGDRRTLCSLYMSRARLWIGRCRHSEAARYLIQAHETIGCFEPTNQERLALELLEARVCICGSLPLRALEILDGLSKSAHEAGDRLYEARAKFETGNVYRMCGRLSDALSSWNTALGLAQDMGDVILRANLLAGIADVALQMGAWRTAKSASVQSGTLARHTGDSRLLVRGDVHGAVLKFESGDKRQIIAELGDACRKFSEYGDITERIRVLSLMALYGPQTGSTDDFFKAARIYQGLIRQLDRYGMRLAKAGVMEQYAGFLIKVRQRAEAIESLREAGSIYRTLGLERACARIARAVSGIIQGGTPAPSR